MFVCTTVLLETECVLRSVYAYAAGPLARALRAFAGLQHVTIEDAGAAAQALDWMDRGTAPASWVERILLAYRSDPTTYAVGVTPLIAPSASA